jgi:glycosyltransferase involved in cell wall biosynthesis
MTENYKKGLISVVISAYNEEGNIPKLYEELTKNLEGENYELLFVNDGSKDGTFTECEKLLKADERVKIVDFERNFGHEIAMTAGLDYAEGEAVIFMDADLQHPPEILPQMIKHWKEGFDVVLTRILKNEQKSFLRNFLVNIYYFILNLLSDVKIPRSTPDFRLIGRRYVEILKTMNEQERMFRGMLNWLGTKNCKIIEFSAPKRFSGETHYNFKASVKLAINSIIQFSIKPLRLATYLGIFFAMFAVLFGFYVLYEYFALSKPASGYTTIVLLISVFSSVQLIILGIIGEYIGRIHLETKKRPLYFAKKWQR